MPVHTHDVVIAGGGPTGMLLAGELALAGVDVAIVEKRENQQVEGSRAGGLHPRAIELLDQRGIAARFIDQGTKHHFIPFAGTVLDGSDRATRHNYTLALWQGKVEAELARWIDELSVKLYRGRELTDFIETSTHVESNLSDGLVLHSPYLVGCDGGRSIVRKLARIEFGGWDPSLSYLIFESLMADEPAIGVHYGPRGINALSKLEDGVRVRGVVTEQELVRGSAPDAGALRAALAAAFGTDFGVHDISWLSRFTDAARQAATYRKGRVLLAGDAAHVHSPVGGQGLNVGMHDAVNLGWKLARVVKGALAHPLLDTYHDERHPVGAALLRHTLALTAMSRGDARSAALREFLSEMILLDEPRRWFGALISGLDTRYDLGEGHAMLGRRVPDLDLVVDGQATRVFALLHAAKPVLLNLGTSGALRLDDPPDDLVQVDARAPTACELPVLGSIELPGALLIRPDGHVAWTGEVVDNALRTALARWCGGTSGAAA